MLGQPEKKCSLIRGAGDAPCSAHWCPCLQKQNVYFSMGTSCWQKDAVVKNRYLSAGKMVQWEEFLPNEREDVSVVQPGIVAHFCNLGSPRVRWHPPCSWGSNLMYTADQRL